MVQHYTPVLDAVFVDSHEILDLFLSAGMTTTSKLVDDKTILHVAALISDLRMVEILQNARLSDLDTETVDSAGYTALDYLRLGKDRTQLMEPFQVLLLSVNAASQHSNNHSTISPSALQTVDEDPPAETIFDALESQFLVS